MTKSFLLSAKQSNFMMAGMDNFLFYLRKPTGILLLYFLIALLASFISFYSPPVYFSENLPAYTKYNNYLIFKESFWHLLEKKNLYELYLNEHWDYFKYTPTFALLFGPFALMPDLLGLIFWNSLNSVLLAIAVLILPNLDQKQKFHVLLFLMIECFTALQNQQSNPLLAALAILAFTYLEKNHYFSAYLFICLAFYIKLFGILLILLGLFYPNKIRQGFYFLFWLIILGLLPLFFISQAEYLNLLKAYYLLLEKDSKGSFGISLIGIVKDLILLPKAANFTLLIGLLLLSLPLFWHTQEFYFRLSYLSWLLLFFVLFNHKAESPTFIIAMSGVALWFFGKQEKTKLDFFLLFFSFILTSLSTTDLSPYFFRKEIYEPYKLKAIPIIFIYFKVFWEFLQKAKIFSLTKCSFF